MRPLPRVSRRRIPRLHLARYRRLERTVGLCWIFLVLPICFLAPRVYEQVIQRTFKIAFVRAEGVAIRLEQALFASSLEWDTTRQNPSFSPSDRETIRSAMRKAADESLLGPILTVEVRSPTDDVVSEVPERYPLWMRLCSFRRRAADPLTLFDRSLTGPLAPLTVRISAPFVPFGHDAFSALIDAVTLGVALLVGGLAIYRLGLGHLTLLEQKDAFVAGVTHELKAPLAAIQLYAGILEQGWNDEANSRERCFRVIRAESERLGRLVDNVLAFARTSPGGSVEQGSMQEIPLGRLLESAEMLLKDFLTPHGFAIVPEHGVAPEVLEKLLVKVHPDWMAQIVYNIADNALKFTLEGERRELQLRSVLDLRKDRVSIILRDYGCGFDAALAERLFEPFFRAADLGPTPANRGSGIGLAVVRALMGAMGGRARAEVRNPGAAIVLEFPLVRLI